MQQKLTQQETQDLIAYLDGELTGDRGEHVERMLSLSDTWRGAADELEILDEVLDSYTIPAPANDLVERIIAGVNARRRGRGKIVRLAAVLAPLAGLAAAVVLAVVIGLGGDNGETTGVTAGRDAAVVAPGELDEIVVENLDFFRDYHVLANFETLEAIERIEAGKI